MTTCSEDIRDKGHLLGLQQSSSELYNACRAAMKKRENNPEEPSLRQLAILRYCACLVLHGSILTSVKEAGDKTVQSQQVIQLIPDVLRAYLHTAKWLSKLHLDDYYKDCFTKGLSILDDVEPVLKVIDTGASLCRSLH